MCIPNEDYPGYVGEEPMELYQATLRKGDYNPDTVISYYWDEEKGQVEAHGLRLRHSALFLGTQDGEKIIFDQINMGERFRITTEREFVEKLAQHKRETLERRFYTT